MLPNLRRELWVHGELTDGAFSLLESPPHFVQCPHQMAGGKPQLDWNSVDGSHRYGGSTDCVRLTLSVAANGRKVLGNPKPKTSRRRQTFLPKLEKWKHLDWRQTNNAVGQQMGVSGERARQVRALLGEPRATIKGLRLVTLKSLNRVKANLERIRGRSISEVSALLGVSLTRRNKARQFLEQQNVLRDGRLKHPWHIMNFALGDSCLSEVWRIKRAVISIRRFRTARWTGRTYRAGAQGCEHPEFQQAVKAERAKARRWRSAERQWWLVK